MRIKEFSIFTLKIIVTHSLTYFIFGLVMSIFFDYGRLFQEEIIKDYMRPIDSAYVLAGPFLQPLRGFLFALGIWPFRKLIIENKHGWLILWNTIIVFGILSTPSAAPCSVEGIIYSKLPLWYHLIGLPELLLQTLVFSFITVWWIKKRPDEKPVSQQSKWKRQFTFVVMCIMIACFGYVGYAIGGILSAKVAGVDVNIKQASVNLKSQMMFVAAFVVNVLFIYRLSREWIKGRLNLYLLFLIFWVIDTLIPVIYQSLFTHVMPLHLALLLGFFPALIIVFSLYFNRKNILEMKQESHDVAF